MNQWHSISLFLSVAEKKSFTRTAKERKLSVMAVSKQIQQLEASLEQQLFERTTRRVELTEFAEHYYTYCKQIEKTMQNAHEFVKAQQKEICGTLRIFATPIFADYFILPMLADFMQHYPKLKIKLISSAKASSFKSDKFDILIGLCTASMDKALDLRYRRCFKSQYVLAASPNYLAQYGEPKTILDLNDHHFIVNVLYDKPIEIKFSHDESITNLKTILELDNTKAMYQAAGAGIGIIKTPYCYVKSLIDRGKLCLLLNQYSLAEFSANIFYKPTFYELRKIRCFIDFLFAYNQDLFAAQ